MAVEAQWSAKEMHSLGSAVAALEELLQEWEAEYEFKVTDLMMNIGTTGRSGRPLGLVSLQSLADTELQFEAVDASLTIA